VIVPIKTWEKINNNYEKLQNKLEVILSIRNGIEEIKTAKKTGKKLQTLKDFLSERND
jgi:hypothetical protein